MLEQDRRLHTERLRVKMLCSGRDTYLPENDMALVATVHERAI